MDEVLRAALDQWPGPVRERAFAADRALMTRVPGMSREIQPDGRLVGYMRGTGYRGTVFTLLLSRSGVKIGFSHGATLPDPARLLGGSGKVHRTFTVQDVTDMEMPAFLDLLDAAASAWAERTAGRET
jgi:hypothetical protein